MPPIVLGSQNLRGHIFCKIDKIEVAALAYLFHLKRRILILIVLLGLKL